MRRTKVEDKFSSSYYIDKYSNARNKPADLFDSEKYFIPRVISPNSKILDIGCAVGGFSEILRSYHANIEYYGIDISTKMIKSAKKKYPKHHFQVLKNISSIGFEDNFFDIVQSWGVSVHEPEYKQLISESWRVTSRAVIFDMRLKEKGHEIVDKNISYTLNPGGIKYDYVVANFHEFLIYLTNLDPAPKLIEIIGYIANPNRFSMVPKKFGKIYMCGVGIYKSDQFKSKKNTLIKLNLPDVISDSIIKKNKNIMNVEFLKDREA